MPEDKKPQPKPVVSSKKLSSDQEALLKRFTGGAVGTSTTEDELKPKPRITTGGGFKEEAKVKPLTSEQKSLLTKTSTKTTELFGTPQEFKKGVKEAEARQLERETELSKISELGYMNVENLYTVLKNDETGQIDLGGGSRIRSSEELDSYLQNPGNIRPLFFQYKDKIGQYFKIANDSDFQNVLSGGVSMYDKGAFKTAAEGGVGRTIFDPEFTRKYETYYGKEVGVGMPGYRPEFDKMNVDPVSQKYKIAQRDYQARQMFDMVVQKGLNKTAYGENISDYKKYYDYILDPINRDAYGRKYNKEIKAAGLESAQKILKDSNIFIDAALGAGLARAEDQTNMRIAKADDLIAQDLIGNAATVFNDGENKSIASIEEENLGKLVWEQEVGNYVSYDVDLAGSTTPNLEYSTVRYGSFDYDQLVKKLEQSGLEGDEIPERLEYYKTKYLTKVTQGKYNEKRAKQGFFVDPTTGIEYSKYDQAMDQRAISSLSPKEQKIATLYKQIGDIMATAQTKDKKKTAISPQSLAQINNLKSQIEQLKKEIGVSGIEFYDASGKRYEGEQKQLAQKVYNSTLAAEKKTDLAIIKEKRNVLFEKRDWIENQISKLGSSTSMGFNQPAILPAGMTEDDIDAALEQNRGFWFNLYANTLGQLGQPDQRSLGQKIYAYKLMKLNQQMTEVDAQLKAANTLVHLNVDLTKGESEGVFSGAFSKTINEAKNIFSDDVYLTPNEEIVRAANFLKENGLYVNPEVINAQQKIMEDQSISDGFLESLKAATLIGIRSKGITNTLKDVYTGKTALVIRSYMADRYGKSGMGVYNVVEKAIVNYGIPFFSYEAANLAGGMGVAEKFGQQAFDKATGVLNLGKFIPSNKIGALFYTLGRTISSSAASFTEETFSNAWEVAKQNGYDFIDAAKNAYGATEDERLLNLRATALMCFTFSSLNLENASFIFSTRQKFQAHLDKVYGENASAEDEEIIRLLDNTIKNSDLNNSTPSGMAVAAAPVNINQNTARATVPVDYAVNMTEADAPNNMKTTTGSSVDGSVGNDQIKVEKRLGNLGEEFYVSDKNGVVDNKVVYRYDSETGVLQARGLTSTTDEFVALNDKTRDFVEAKARDNGIVSRQKAETIARKNLGITETEEKINERDGKVVYQTTQNESSRRKKERVDKANASGEAEFKSKFNNNASQSIALFTGVAENVDETTDDVKNAALDISRSVGSKIKINLSSFVSNGKALITNAVRKKVGKVADYMAPLLKDFDSTLFTVTGKDEATGAEIKERKTNNLDKFRSAVARSNFYNETMKKLVDEGKITQEDAIDNLVSSLLLNKLDKIKEIFGNDTEAIQAFRDLRTDFNNFVGVKYTGSQSVGKTEKFLLNTVMSQTTTKSRKADLSKKAADVVKEQMRRNEVATILDATGQKLDAEQVDAVRLILGEITPYEYLENTGVDMTNMTQQQIADEAKAKSEGAVDMQKYNEALERKAANDLVRTKWKRKLNRDAGNVWGFKSMNPFKSTKARKERKATTEIAIRAFEANAQRAGMTLDDYMNNMIETKKMTEEQFNVWLSQNPGLVPFFQNNLTPAQLAADVNKALELQKKGMDTYRIELLTGVSFDAFGNPIPTSAMLEVNGEFTNMQKNFFVSRYELKQRVKSEPLYGTKFVKPFNKLLGRAYSSASFKQEEFIYKLSELIGDNALINKYPDLQLSNVRIIYEPGIPAFQFVPNFNYSREAKGTEFARPGDIVINMATMKDQNDLLPGLTRAVRKGAQFIENEYLPATTDTFISPSTILSAALELQVNGKLTEAQVNTISDMIDFYKDKNIFQYAQYKSVFSDLARILFYSNAKNLNETTIIENIGYTYGLSDQEIKEFKNKIFKHLTDMKNGGENADIFFSTALKLSGLSETQLLDENFAYEFNPKLISNPIKVTSENVINDVIDYVNNNKIDILSGLTIAIDRLSNLATDRNFTKSEKNKAQVIKTALVGLKNAITGDKYFNGAFDYNIALLSLRDTNVLQDSISDVMSYGTLDIEDELGNVVDIFYRDPESLTFDANELSAYLSDIVDIVNEMKRLDVDKTEAVSEDEVVSNNDARQIYYQMFPGIDKYMGGIFDSYKAASDFTKQELEDAFVGQNLITKQQFEQKYFEYQNKPELKYKSAASIFLDQNVLPKNMNTKQLADLQKKQFIAIQMRNNYAKNLGTVFYNNVDVAIADKYRKDVPIDLNSLRKTLISGGAKEAELNFMGLDDFIKSMTSRVDADGNPQTTITKQELLDWATTRPELVSYDRFSETQTRTVEKVYILNEISKLDNYKKFVGNIAVDLTTSLKVPRVAGVFVYFSDGNYRLIDLTKITDEDLTVYKKYSNTEEYAELLKTLADIKQIIGRNGQIINIDAEKKKALENLIKIKVELTDELDRKTYYEGTAGQEFEGYKGNIQGAGIPNTYQEHLLTIPVTDHPYIKNLNDQLNNLLEKLSEFKIVAQDELFDEVGNLKPEYNNFLSEYSNIESAIITLVEQRNSFIQKYVDRHHFNKNPNTVLAHARTEVAVDEFGDLVLYVHEIQSDQTQKIKDKLVEQKSEFILANYYPNKSFLEIIDSIKDEHLTTAKKQGVTEEELTNISDYYESAKAKKDMFGNILEPEKVVVGYFDKDKVFTSEEKSAYDSAALEMKRKLKLSTPFPTAEAFTDLVIKQLMKVASDKGISKIVIGDPALVGPAVTEAMVEQLISKQVQGINKYYNETIPKQIALIEKKLGFTTSKTKLSEYNIDHENINSEIKPLYDLMRNSSDFKTYVSQVGLDNVIEIIKKQGNVDVTNKPISQVEEEFNKIKDSYYAKEKVKYWIPNSDFLTINMTPQTNRIVAEGMAMFSRNATGAHGATVNMDTGKTIMFALTNPNVFTAMHELAHVREKFLTPDERLEFLQSVGHDVWTRETSELFARGFERYLAEGKAPSSKLQKIFEDFKKWMYYIYQYIQGSEIDVPLSDGMRRIYDSMLGEAKTTAAPKKQSPAQNIFDDIAKFIDGIKSNPEFKGITDDELYSALLKTGFDPVDLQDYFSLRQRANIEKQQRMGGMFKEEADVLENEQEAIRVVRDQKALMDEIENIDPIDYPVILQTLFDEIENGDVPLAMAIKELIDAKQRNNDPEFVRNQYAKILKAGTDIGRMLQLFRQLTKDSFLSSTRALFNRAEKKGLTIPEEAKKRILDLASQLDNAKEQYKLSKADAEANPYGVSRFNPNKTNLEYNQDMYNQYMQAAENYVNERSRFEGDDSVTETYISFVKGGLMTPSSLAVNNLSNIVKFMVTLVTDPLSSAISWVPAKVKSLVTGVKMEPTTKKNLRDFWTGVTYGMPKGFATAYRILKDGTLVQSYQTPQNYAMGFNSFKAMSKSVQLWTTLAARSLGYNNFTNEEIADKYGYKLNEVGKISKKGQLISGMQGTFGVIPDIIFRALSSVDAVFRDFAYYSAVSEDFKFTPTYLNLKKKMANAVSSAEKAAIKKEMDAMRDAYIKINSDYGNANANAEALRFVYSNDNAVTDWISRVKRVTKVDEGNGKLISRMFRLIGTGVVPFTRIPPNYAIELMEFLMPEYALAKMAVIGAKSVKRKVSGKAIEGAEMSERARVNSRDMDRILARALVGIGVQYIASLIVRAGAATGSPSDENEDDKKKSNTYVYSLERPYSINITLLRAMLRGDQNRKSGLWDMKNDLIIDYRGFGVFGAATYVQFREYKEKEGNKKNRFVNRGIIEDAMEDGGFSIFGNYGSAGSYILDQTFVRGIQSFAKTIADAEDDNKLATGLADLITTLSSGILPNSLSFIDKMNRKYVVDYDAKDAAPFKAFGQKVESPFLTTFFTKLGIKMSERWPIGDPDKMVDLPFVEAELDKMPVKVDAFGKPVLQTPEGAMFGKFLYNTFDITRATRGVAGYETPDWEALVYLACKKGDAWQALPTQLPKMLVDRSGNQYKLGTEEYNNFLIFNANVRRDLVQKYIIDNKVYEKFIDMNSELNYDAEKKAPIGGMDNPNVLFGYEQLGSMLSKIYAAADAMTMLGTWTLIDKERYKMYTEDKERFFAMQESEMRSILSELPAATYGGQETGDDYENFVRKQRNGQVETPYRIDMDIVSKILKDPNYFAQFSTGLIEEMKKFNGNIETAIITPNNQNNMNDGDILNQYDFDYEGKGTKPSKIQQKVINEKKEAGQSKSGLDQYDFDYTGEGNK